MVSLVDQDVGGHQHRIGEQPDTRGFGTEAGDLVLELGHPVGLAETGDTAEDPGQLGMFGHVRLDEESGLRRVDTGGKELRRSTSVCWVSVTGSCSIVRACRSAMPKNAS